MSGLTDTCNWDQEDDEYAAFETDCGNSFVMGDGVDDYDWLKFCCYCGKRAVAHPWGEGCKHPNMGVIPDAEGDLDEKRLTRHFTTYDCPDCGYNAESPPQGWLPPFDEPTDGDN